MAALILSALAPLLAALDGPPLPSIAGAYAVRHPDPDWGAVIVSFSPAGEWVDRDGESHPAYRASIWKRRADGLRKLRDGLFGAYRRAALVEDSGSLALAWLGGDEGGEARPMHRVVEIRADGSLVVGPWNGAETEGAARIGGSRAAEDRGASLVTLERVADEIPELASFSPIALSGAYRYGHPGAGDVLGAFRRVDALVPAPDGALLPAWSAWTVREVPSLGYAERSEGLYGGARPDDEYPLVAVQDSGDGPRLVWWNPRRPDRWRLERITTRYASGDLGVSGQGEAGAAFERSRFVRVAGPDARVGPPSSFIDLDGLYEARLRGEVLPFLAVISPSALRSGDRALHRVDRAGEADGELRIESRGLRPGDPFRYLSLEDEDGRCLIRLHAPSSMREERFYAVDIEADGSFSLSGASSDAGPPVAEFRKRRSLTAEVPEP